jgi:hypothetical protein
MRETRHSPAALRGQLPYDTAEFHSAFSQMKPHPCARTVGICDSRIRDNNATTVLDLRKSGQVSHSDTLPFIRWQLSTFC